MEIGSLVHWFIPTRQVCWYCYRWYSEIVVRWWGWMAYSFSFYYEIWEKACTAYCCYCQHYEQYWSSSFHCTTTATVFAIIFVDIDLNYFLFTVVISIYFSCSDYNTGFYYSLNPRFCHSHCTFIFPLIVFLCSPTGSPSSLFRYPF